MRLVFQPGAIFFVISTTSRPIRGVLISVAERRARSLGRYTHRFRYRRGSPRLELISIAGGDGNLKTGAARKTGEKKKEREERRKRKKETNGFRTRKDTGIILYV